MDPLGGTGIPEPATLAGPPPRKRRRPALSCAECRRRKIKCDRNIPCRQCTLSKSATCTFSPERLSSVNIHGNKAEAVPSQSQVTSSAGIGVPPTSNLSFLLDNSPQADHSGSNTSPSNSSASHPGPDQNVVQTLVDRVQKLEQALAATSLDGSAGCRTKTPAKKDIDRSFWHKTRFYGQSHWMHPFEQVFSSLNPFMTPNKLIGVQARQIICFEYLPGGMTAFKMSWGKGAKEGDEVNRLVDLCKVVARTIKGTVAPQWPSWIPDLEKTVPSREICDQLLHLYFRTSESACRILHIPSFWIEYEEYWSSPQTVSQCSLVKILLVMALGICFYQGPDLQELRNRAQQWIYATQAWLVMPNEKSRLTISGIQVQCLLVICRSLFNIGGDLNWISSGTVMRAAINMGFHRDPQYFPRMSVLQGEVRRRLWATILELNLTNALDCGMPPMISRNDYDTEAPLNINDDEITESTQELPTPNPDTVFTQTSIQLAVLRSYDVRVEVTSMINDFRFEPSYDEVIRLGASLLKTYKENHKFISDACSATSSPELAAPTPLDRKVLDLTTQRWLIALHRPFAMKAVSNPKYYYSRKIYLDSAIAILQHPDPESGSLPDENELHDDYHRFCLSGGYLKEVTIHAAIVVYLEMVIPLEEDPDMTFTQERKRSREPYRRLLEQAIELTRQRIAIGGETNVKGHLFMSVALGHIDAIQAGRSTEEGILEAALKSAKLCYELLRARLPSTPDMNTVKEDEFSATDFDSGQINSDMPNNDIDFTMADWGAADFEIIPDAWMFSPWDENTSW